MLCLPNHAPLGGLMPLSDLVVIWYIMSFLQDGASNEQ